MIWKDIEDLSKKKIIRRRWRWRIWLLNIIEEVNEIEKKKKKKGDNKEVDEKGDEIEIGNCRKGLEGWGKSGFRV